jgi:hypothetical protein
VKDKVARRAAKELASPIADLAKVIVLVEEDSGIDGGGRRRAVLLGLGICLDPGLAL